MRIRKHFIVLIGAQQRKLDLEDARATEDQSGFDEEILDFRTTLDTSRRILDTLNEEEICEFNNRMFRAGS
ncbi:hypothetical protein D910_05050, partial [Dendroctonus ponderosae]